MSFEEITKRLCSLSITVYENEVPRNAAAPAKLPYIVWGYENESFTGGDEFICIRESDIFIELWETKGSNYYNEIINVFSDTALTTDSYSDSKNHIRMSTFTFKNLQEFE